MLKESAYLSCAKLGIDDSHKISNSTAFITETNQVMWSSPTIPHGRTIVFMVTPANVGSRTFSNIFDPGKNGLHLTDNSVTRLQNELATRDPSVVFSYIPFQDDMERLVEMCSLEMFLLQNVNAHLNDKVIIIADTRHTQWSERKVDPMLCHGDLAFFCSCTVTLESWPLWANEQTPGTPRNVEDLEKAEFADVLGAIAEDQHLTRYAQVCFTGSEEDQA